MTDKNKTKEQKATPQELFMAQVVEKTEMKEHVVMPTAVFLSVSDYLKKKPIEEAGDLFYSLNGNTVKLDNLVKLLHADKDKVEKKVDLKKVPNSVPTKAKVTKKKKKKK